MMDLRQRCKMLYTHFTEKRYIYIPLFFTIVVVLVVLQYFFPTDEYAVWPPCPIYYTTGIHCPGCGSTRALACLLRGDISGSLSMNILFIPIVVCMVALVCRPKLALNRTFTISVVAVGLVFCLLRNLPWYPFTLLAPH